MRIIDRYLIQELITPLLLAITGLSVLFVSSIIFEMGSYLIVRRVHPYLVGMLVLYKIPSILTMTLPIGTLFGTLFAIGRLAKDRELAVLQMLRTKSFRLFLPYLIIALAISGLSLGVNEIIVPTVNSKAELVMRKIIFDNPPAELMQNVFFHDKDRFYYIGRINPNSNQLQNIMIFELQNGKVDKMTVAESGEYQSNVWTLQRGLNYQFDTEGHIKNESTYSTVQLAMQDVDKSIFSIEKTSQDMNREELKQFIEILREQGVQTLSYEVDYYFKITTPLATFIFVFLGIPLISRVRTKEKLYTTAICIGIVFLYYIFSSVCAASGRANILPPLLAAWSPTLLFLTIGVTIFWWVDHD